MTDIENFTGLEAPFSVTAEKLEATYTKDKQTGERVVDQPVRYAITLRIEDANYEELYYPIQAKVRELLGTANDDVTIGISNGETSKDRNLSLIVINPPKDAPLAEISGVQREQVETRVNELVERLSNNQAEIEHAIASYRMQSEGEGAGKTAQRSWLKRVGDTFTGVDSRIGADGGPVR